MGIFDGQAVSRVFICDSYIVICNANQHLELAVQMGKFYGDAEVIWQDRLLLGLEVAQLAYSPNGKSDWPS